jgi:hypothetical protein
MRLGRESPRLPSSNPCELRAFKTPEFRSQKPFPMMVTVGVPMQTMVA